MPGETPGQEVRGLRFPARSCHCLAVIVGRSSALAGALLLIYLINSEQASCFVSYSVSRTTLLHGALFYLKGARLRMAKGQEAEKQAQHTPFPSATHRLGSKAFPIEAQPPSCMLLAVEHCGYKERLCSPVQSPAGGGGEG